MSSSSTMPRSRFTVSTGPTLREEVRSRTGSERETSSILRSIERFEGDDSIEHFEVTPQPVRGTRHDARAVSWQVRAIRPEDPEDPYGS